MSALNDVTDAFVGWLESVEVTRVVGGSYVNGRWQVGTETTLIIEAVVQNATEEDLKVLPENLYTAEAIKLHTVTALNVLTDEGIGDKINYLNKTWLVHSLANRQIGGYYKAIAIRQN